MKKDRYARLSKITADALQAGMDFIERSKTSKGMEPLENSCLEQSRASSSPTYSQLAEFTEENSTPFDDRRRNAVCEIIPIERDGLSQIVKDEQVKCNLRIVCGDF